MKLSDNNSIIQSLDENQKNQLVIDHKNIVFYMAHKFRFLDTDFDEVLGWAYFGLAKAIQKYEENPHEKFADIAFMEIKTTLFNQYYSNKRKRKKEESLQSDVLTSKEGDSIQLEDRIADESPVYISAENIESIINQALFEESELYKKIIYEIFMTQKEPSTIAKEYAMPLSAIKKIQGRGKSLIINYLMANDIILDYSMHPTEQRKRKEKIINHQAIPISDYGKIKFIFREYNFLSINDIAILLNTSSYAVNYLLDYPTVTYIKTPMDDSIKEKVLRYCKRKYPGRLPSPVMISKFENKIMT